MTSDRIKTLLCIPAGAAAPLAFAPFGLFWVASLSYGALFYVWCGATSRQAFMRGGLYGFASFFAGMYWVYISVHDFGLVPVSLSVFLTVGLVAIMALFVALTGWAAVRWFRTEGQAAWLGALPALWVLTEWCRGWFLTGFGWQSAGYSQSDSWLMAYAPIFGLHGMGWAVMLTAGAAVTLIFGDRRSRRNAVLVMLALWGIGFAFTDYRWTQPEGQPLDVALVQGAVPQDLKWRPEQLASTMALYRRLTLSVGKDAELIVWPEAAIPALYDQVESYLAQVGSWAARRDAVVMLGILRRHPETGTYQNSLVALAEPPQIYVKRHLVPFGEYFPVPDFVRSWMRLMSLPNVDVVPGKREQGPLALAGERIGITICYEDVFGAEQLHYLPEATLLVNVSNDAWFGDSTAPHQHLQIARLRAAEAGRYLLRATNTGITAVIDPRGRVVERLAQFEPAVLESTVQGFTGLTPYARWGNYPVVIGAALILLVQLLTTKLTMRPGT